MSLIICSECGKEYSDRATACPNCACPSPLADNSKSSTGTSTTKTKHHLRPIVITIIVIALLTVAIGHVRKIYLYNIGLDALYVGDYSTARNCLEGLDHDDSNLIMNDLSFLEDLEEIVNAEISYDSEVEYIMNAAERNLEKLRKYKVVEFYTDGLNKALEQYIEGLEEIIAASNCEKAADIQYKFLAGKYYCDHVVVGLHDGIGFMQNSSKYAEVYSDIIAKEEAMLTAFEELSEKGNVVTQDGNFWSNEIRLYLRNDTEYGFDRTYSFDFYNYAGDQFLETVTVDVLGIEPNAEYTVCVNVPYSARNGYQVKYSYYYLDINIPD